MSQPPASQPPATAGGPDPTDHAFAAAGGGLLAALDRALSVVENIVNAIAGWVVFALMLFAVAQIGLRQLFNMPIKGYVDIIEIVMIVFTLGGIAYCQRLGGHVRMEMLLKPLKGRVLWFFEALGVALAFGVVAVIAWYAVGHFQRAWDFGDTTADILLPTWPAKLFAPFALFVLLARLGLQFWGYCRLFLYPDAPPIAVSLMIDEEEIARREIEESRGHDVDLPGGGSGGGPGGGPSGGPGDGDDLKKD